MICEVCGCKDEMACIDLDTGLPCHWADEDLCSVCAKGGLALRSWPMPEEENNPMEKDLRIEVEADIVIRRMWCG